MSAQRANTSTTERQVTTFSVLLVAGVAAAVGGLSWSVANTTYDTWGGILVGIGLLLVGVPLTVRAARRETDPRIGRLIIFALPLKMLMTLARLAVAFGLYDGAIDAVEYHRIGQQLAPMYRAGEFGGTVDLGSVPGTGFIEILTGAFYTVTGPTKLGGFLVFSWLGFWGLYFFYRAFAIACPEGDRWRYARLVLLLPSLLFWPSSLGKEAWMTFGLGLAALGAAKMFARQRGAFLALLGGLAATTMVRPHVAAIFVAGLLLAYLFRKAPEGQRVTNALRKLVGVVVLGVLLTVSLVQAEKVFGFDSYNRDAVVGVLLVAEDRTSAHGTDYDLSQNSNLDISRFPGAAVSVLFRPWPWEARNAQSFIAALEGFVLLLLFVAGWRRIVGAIRSILRTPYVILCMTYSVLFVFGFSSFANFGILTRQRVQVLPFIVVLLALPPFKRSRYEWRELLVEGSTEPKETSQPGLVSG